MAAGEMNLMNEVLLAPQRCPHLTLVNAKAVTIMKLTGSNLVMPVRGDDPDVPGIDASPR